MAVKKNANGEGNITYRPAKKLFEGRLPVGHKPDGKIKFRYFYGKTKTEVKKAMQKARLDIEDGKYIEPQKYTVGSWLDEWQKTYLSHIKPMTLEEYQYQIRVHIKPAIGDIKLQSLTRVQVQKFYNSLSLSRIEDQEMKNGTIKKVQAKPLSPKSIKNLHGVLHKAMQKAYELDMIPKNPCDFCELPKVIKKEMHTAAEDTDLKAFLEAIKGDPFEDLFKVTVFSGVRESEVLGLTWDCIDFKTGQIHVYRQLQKLREKGTGYSFAPLKNNKQRTFAVAPYVVEVLKKVKHEQNQNKLKAGGAWRDEYGLIFTNELGKHFGRTTVFHHFKACAEKAGHPEWRFHDLRHTYATIRLENGDDIKTVSSALGHATTAFTMDQYGHVTERMQRESADRMQAKIEGL